MNGGMNGGMNGRMNGGMNQIGLIKQQSAQSVGSRNGERSQNENTRLRDFN